MIALAGAAGIAAEIATRLPQQMRLSTDLVGFPIYFNYNIERVFDLYYIVAIVFPISTLLLYLGLTLTAVRLGLLPPRTEQRQIMDAPGEVNLEVPAWPGRAGSLVRILGLGCLFGLEVAVFRGSVFGSVWKTMSAVAGAYLIAVLVCAYIARRRFNMDRSLVGALATINALATPLAIGGLLMVSWRTALTVSSDRTVHYYHWFPIWLAMPLMFGALALIAWQLIRSRSDSARLMIERRALIVIGGATLIFLFEGSLPGALGPMDMYHEGEALVPARLTAAGAFPWRDLLTIHGLFQDSLSSMLGMHLFDNSRWGAEAGMRLVVSPLSLLSLYLFGARFFWRNWLFLLAFCVALIGGPFVPHLARFMLWPVTLVLLSFALERPRWWLGILLGASLVADTVLVPEMAYCIPACGVTVLLRDLTSLRRVEGLWRGVAGTLWTIAGGIGALAALVVVLISQHALQAFIFYFVIFAPGHELTGGIVVPSLPVNGISLFWMLSPVVAILLSFWGFAVHLVRRTPLETEGWVMLAAAIVTMLYYPKFLARGDVGHLLESYLVAIPLISLVLFRICRRLDKALTQMAYLKGLPRRITLRPLALLLLVATILPAPLSLLNRTVLLSQRYRAAAPSEPWLASLGYSKNAIDQATYEDIRAVLHSYLGPNDWVFDFSNEPGLTYYLLGYAPHTRYYHVSMAIPEVAQVDLIKELQRDSPKLVVFTNDRYGQPGWDLIPNMVRHYDVSQYILDHYQPLLSIRGQIIYSRIGTHLPPPKTLDGVLKEPVVTDDLPFRNGACSWGYSPNFLSTSPVSPIQTAVSMYAASSTDAQVSGWVADPSDASPVQQVLLVLDGRVASSTFFLSPRPDKTDIRDTATLTARGFDLNVPRVALTAAHSIRVLAITADGFAFVVPFSRAAQQLPATVDSGSLIDRVVLPSGATSSVKGAALGAVESVATKLHTIEITPPAGKSWADYHWIEIDSPSGFQADTFTVSDQRSPDPGRQIMFQAMSTSPTRYRVQVGSCAQWHGYGAKPLFISFRSSEHIASIKLYS